MAEPIIGIIMGSDSDLDVMSAAAKTLDEFAGHTKSGSFLPTVPPMLWRHMLVKPRTAA